MLKLNRPTTSEQHEGEILQTSNLKSFKFKEPRTATRNFQPDSALVEVSFGCVFEGWVDGNPVTATEPGTGMVIAFKRLNQETLNSFIFDMNLSWRFPMSSPVSF
ncbi:hypothetical protein V6N12_057889 [Hibiscus sabdariffa]|uniref:Uncharacterized protein n=1 Tax=Hibiscus sabdariffa TaxID=183260 RepID=A0ABR2B3Y7_9ROSI